MRTLHFLLGWLLGRFRPPCAICGVRWPRQWLRGALCPHCRAYAFWAARPAPAPESAPQGEFAAVDALLRRHGL